MTSLTIGPYVQRKSLFCRGWPLWPWQAPPLAWNAGVRPHWTSLVEKCLTRFPPRGLEDETSTPPPAAPLLCPLVPPCAPPPWATVRGLRHAGADHQWGHTAPCSDDPSEIPQVCNHGNTLHARAQSVAVHGLPRSGRGIYGFFRQSLSKFLGGL